VISAVAFCPHPPVLVPEVAQGAAAELADLRAACGTAIRRAVAPGTEIIAVGVGDRWQRHEPTARGSLAPYGVPLEIPLGADEPGPVELPLSLTVGAWLLRDTVGPNCGAWGWSVGPGAAGRPAALEPDDGVPRALIVMADGSARRSAVGPGSFDERSARFDAAIADALGSGAVGGLHLAAEPAAELLVGGAAAWDEAAHTLAGAAWDAELLYDAAPYGVGYFVATWTRRCPPEPR
jgi:hypothetical protein